MLTRQAQALPAAPHDHADHAHETVCLRLAAAPGLCTHGPDTPPKGAGRDPMPSVAQINRRIKARTYDLDLAAQTYSASALTTPVVCGTAGPRVQAVYLHHPGANRYSQLLPTIRKLAFVADDYVNRSAGQVGTGLRIRWATTSDCKISVKRVVVPLGARTNFNTSIAAMAGAGLKSPSRKYVAWLDTTGGLCGIGTSIADDRATQLNANNQNTGYAQINRTCWGGGAEMHELFHTLGAVQASAPRSTAYGHCRDEQDAMCYVDGPGTTMISPAPCAGAFQWQLDCKKNDYFSPKPKAGTYIASHWNTAKSRWLQPDDPPPTAPTITLPDANRRLIGLKWQLSALSQSANGPITYRWKVVGYGANGFVAVPCSFSSTTVRQPQFWCRPNGFAGPILLTVTATDSKGMTNATQRQIFFFVPTSPRATTVTMSSNPGSITGTASSVSVSVFATVTEQATGLPLIGMPVRFFDPATFAPVDRVTNVNGVARYDRTVARRFAFQASSATIFGFRDGAFHVVWQSDDGSKLVEWTPVFSTPVLSGASLSGTLLPAEVLGWDYVDLHRRDSAASAWSASPVETVQTTSGGAYEFTLSGLDAAGVQYQVRKPATYINRYGAAESAIVTVP